MVDVKSRLLDAVVLLRVYEQSKSFEFNDSLIMANIFASDGTLKKQKGKYSTIYRVSYEGKKSRTNLSFRFFSVRSKPAISIKFCPSKLTEDEWADAQSWFQGLFGVGEIWDKFHISRAEFAVDYRIPYSDLFFLDSTKTIFDDKLHKVGTQYLGARNGRKSCRIYDKAKQLAEVKSVYIKYPLTRIEVILTGLRLHINEFDKIDQPYGKIMVIRKSKLKTLMKKHINEVEFNTFGKSVLKGDVAQKSYLKQDALVQKQIINILKLHSLKLHADTLSWKLWKKEKSKLLSKMNDCEPYDKNPPVQLIANYGGDN